MLPIFYPFNAAHILPQLGPLSAAYALPPVINTHSCTLPSQPPRPSLWPAAALKRIYWGCCAQHTHHRAAAQSLQAALDRNTSIENFKTSATEQTSKNISTIYRENPWMSAGTVLALAKGNASPETVSTISKTAARVGMNQADPTVPKKQSWFDRNVMDKIKTATRWSVAGLQAFPEVAQNVASRVAGPNSGSDGWFASTTLGQMVENSDQAGSGFFAGEELMKTQAQKAREFRGEINGHAWTIGRAAADVVFTPGSREYNLLSGAFDFAVQLGTDPTFYAGKAIKAARVAKAAIPAVESATETTALLRAVGTKGAAGLSQAESIAFEANKFAQWSTKSSAANRLWQNLADEENPLKILKSFGDTMDPDTAIRLAGIKTVEGVREVFTEAAVRLDNAIGGANDILLPTNISDISMASRSYATKQKIPLSRGISRVGVCILHATPVHDKLRPRHTAPSCP
jgi:hypothetical protein